MTDRPLQIVPGKTDAEKVADYKRRLYEALQPVMTICAEANAEGFFFTFTTGLDAHGRAVVTDIIGAKKL